MVGTVFKIEELTMHDGNGIRLTVFLKGCPLRCPWCHNPEGLKREPELLYKRNKCVHCNLCMKKCNHKECKPFKRCLHICPNDCLEVCGKIYSSDELATIINSYKRIFDLTGGGVTFSGGEPLLQWDFIKEVIAKINGINTAIETSGYANREIFKDMVNTIDYVFMDIKIFDEEIHKKYLGVSNTLIKENFCYLKKTKANYTIRTPLIDGYTNYPDNLNKIEKFIEGSNWEKLPENKLWKAKYDLLISE